MVENAYLDGCGSRSTSPVLCLPAWMEDARKREAKSEAIGVAWCLCVLVHHLLHPLIHVYPTQMHRLGQHCLLALACFCCLHPRPRRRQRPGRSRVCPCHCAAIQTSHHRHTPPHHPHMRTGCQSLRGASRSLPPLKGASDLHSRLPRFRPLALFSVLVQPATSSSFHRMTPGCQRLGSKA